MKMIKTIFSVIIITLIAACGGGGSSSGGGGDNPLAGIYSGNHTVTVSGGGQTSTDVIFLTLTVNGDGSFRIVDGDGGAGSVPATGNLNGDQFSATGTGSDTVDGISCNLRITYSGTIANNAANGTDSGTATCSSQGTSISLNISGQFNLPKTANAKAPRNGTLIKMVATLLR